MRASAVLSAIGLPAAWTSAGYAMRAATEADAPFERALFETARSDAALLAAWPDAQRIVFLDRQFHFQTAHYARVHPAADRFVLLAKDRPVGRMILDRMGDDWLLVDIAVLPLWRGRGLGKAMLGAALVAAWEAGADMALQVEIGNRAQRLYERLGFMVTRTEPPYRAMLWRAGAAVDRRPRM